MTCFRSPSDRQSATEREGGRHTINELEDEVKAVPFDDNVLQEHDVGVLDELEHAQIRDLSQRGGGNALVLNLQTNFLQGHHFVRGEVSGFVHHPISSCITEISRESSLVAVLTFPDLFLVSVSVRGDRSTNSQERSGMRGRELSPLHAPSFCGLWRLKTR
jgi:hypothetical protein